MTYSNILPCPICIEISSTKKIIPCSECQSNCHCKNDWTCNFCMNIIGHLIKKDNIQKLKTKFPCNCCENTKPEYTFLCLDCIQDYYTCNNKNEYVHKKKRAYFCSYCLEKEHNMIINLAKLEDFPIKEREFASQDRMHLHPIL